jgi:rare lipoprotein A
MGREEPNGLQSIGPSLCRPRCTLGGALRLCAAALGCIVLANCSAQETFARKDRSQRIAEDVEIAKGGGRYSVGKPYNVRGQTYYPAENPAYRAEGIASWYGPDFHGGPTANGERYDMHGYSAAHTTLPLPSYARVTNLGTGKSMIVRVNNRGPFVHNRLIDLSVGTAKALGFYKNGVARVRVEYVGPAPIEGSDDRMLLATLRDGSPAPAPSTVMVASAKPFLPSSPSNSGREVKTPMPTERPFALGSASGKTTAAPATPQLASSESKPVRLPAAKPAGKLPEGATTEASVRPTTLSKPSASPSQTSSFAPSPATSAPNERIESAFGGLMSGRGLY